jgi:Domain of unknown function (DUF4169)
MMATVVNLNQFRKRKERADKEAEAARNRAAFGRPKSEKKLTKAQQKLETKQLEDHKRED